MICNIYSILRRLIAEISCRSRQDISVINRLCMLHISYGKRANLTLEKSINGSFRLIMWYQASNSYAYAQSVLADVFQGCTFDQL